MRPMNATHERATARTPGWMRAVAVHHQISLLAQAPTLRPLPAQSQVPPLLPRPRVDDPPRTQTRCTECWEFAAYGGRKAVAERMRDAHARRLTEPTFGSALRVLRRLARLLQAVLLALDRARVAGQEAGLLQRGPVLRLHQDQRPGDSQTQGAGLARRPAAVEVGKDIDAVHPVHGHQRRLD